MRARWSWTSRTRSSRAPASRAAARSCTRAPSKPWGRSNGPDHRAGHPRPGGVRRLRGHLEGAEHAAHAADERHQRDPRHRRARRPAAPRPGQGLPQRLPARDRGDVRHDQRGRRLPGDRPHARDVQEKARSAEARGPGGGGGGEGRRMSREDAINLAYIVAFSLFIIGLHMLRGPRTAVRGNQVAAVGMAVAVVATLCQQQIGDWPLIALGIVIGTAVGVPAARSVHMTAMPQMVALFNGVGGGAVALISIVEYRRSGGDLELESLIPALFAAIIGSISFWGSIIAFAKLQELISGRPYRIPGGPIVNTSLLVAAVACAVVLAAGTESELLFWLILVFAGALGVLAVLPIGGADMPVVISTLNAFTGLSAAAAGIALDNTVLIVAGMLVGASGSILTKLMADAMNRSIANVFFAGVGTGGPALAASSDGGTVRSTSASDVAIQLSYARLVVVVPGYGMAVAQAQRAVADLAGELEKRGVEVLYGIHPVAGRMPGHMNVLLAEADVPYEKLKEMDEINGEFSRADVSLVIGANDVTNPAARTVADSPIYGMPILDVDKSQSVIVLKRSMNSGFAGIDNPLFYDPKTAMLFGDAKSSVAEILSEVQAL